MGLGKFINVNFIISCKLYLHVTIINKIYIHICIYTLQAPAGFQVAWWIGFDSDNSGTGTFLGLPAVKSGCQFWIEVKAPDEIRGIR